MRLLIPKLMLLMQLIVQTIEEFKEENPNCLVCGFYLASDGSSPQVRHFGLQLVEHYIR